MRTMSTQPFCAAASAVGRQRARCGRGSQRGAAALAVAMVLLFVMTLIPTAISSFVFFGRAPSLKVACSSSWKILKTFELYFMSLPLAHFRCSIS